MDLAVALRTGVRRYLAWMLQPQAERTQDDGQRRQANGN